MVFPMATSDVFLSVILVSSEGGNIAMIDVVGFSSARY